MTNCGGCGKNAGGGTVQCKGCDLWWHQECAGIPKEMYKLILETSKLCGTHCWCCRVCASIQDGIKKSIFHLESQYQKLDGKVDANAAVIQKNTEDLKEIQTDIAEIKENLASSSNDASNKTDIFSEIRERENKKPNIIVHGIPESEGNSEEKAKLDKDQLKKIAAAVGVKLDTQKEVKFCFRIGEILDDKNRPLKVGFYDPQTADRLTSLSLKLKDNPKISFECSIVCDLTLSNKEMKKQNLENRLMK